MRIFYDLVFLVAGILIGVMIITLINIYSDQNELCPLCRIQDVQEEMDRNDHFDSLANIVQNMNPEIVVDDSSRTVISLFKYMPHGSRTLAIISTDTEEGFVIICEGILHDTLAATGLGIGDIMTEVEHNTFLQITKWLNNQR